jgi:hypothetical protein
MSWAKVDDRANEHHKQLDAGPEACWFWVCGLMYANRQPDRDGLIPERALTLLYPVKNPKKLAEKLVEVGLWDKTPGGYQIHNYHGWNPTPEQIEADKAAARERAAKSYANKKAKKPDSAPDSAPAELPQTPAEADPQKRDSAGSTPTPLHSTPEEEDPPSPPKSEPARPKPDPRDVAALRRSAERQDRSYGPQNHKRADVIELHAEWARQFSRNTPLQVGWNSENADILADRIDACGVTDCLVVARNAKFDDMVAGRADEKQAKHESIKYIFGNDEAFSRILRDGRKREAAQASGGSVLTRQRDLKSRDADEGDAA